MGTKSAVRSARQAQHRRTRVQAAKTKVRTALSQARQLLAAGDKAAPEAVREAVRTLDRAGVKGIVHPNEAARHKSSLARKLGQEPGAK